MMFFMILYFGRRFLKSMSPTKFIYKEKLSALGLVMLGFVEIIPSFVLTGYAIPHAKHFDNAEPSASKI